MTETHSLLPHHQRQLESSGLSRETIAESGFYSETSFPALAHILNWKAYPKNRGGALVIPYRNFDGELNGYKRLRPDNPRLLQKTNGKTSEVKYESPKGLPHRPYFPKGVIPFLSQPEAELLITEGEKKALKATQEGFPCIGLPGVFGFVTKDSATMPADLERIAWRGRKVFIVYDSDLAEKPEVRKAESRLAAQLNSRGADVRVVRLPGGEDGEKIGLDDFLIKCGRVELRKLLDSAEAAEPEEDADKLPPAFIDPAEQARRFVEVYGTHRDKERKLRYWRDTFWVWDGTRYVEMPDPDMQCRVFQHLDASFLNLKQAHVSNTLLGIKAETIVGWRVEMPCWLGKGDNPPRCLAMQNGILDLDRALAGEADCLLSHSPRWFSPVCLPYAYDPAATCETWLQVLDRNLEGNHERIAILQEWHGYLFLSDTSFQKFLMLVGEGNNGKSVQAAAMTAQLGQDNVSAVPLESFGVRFQLNATLGKLANIAAEVGELDKVAEGFLKSFTSGDTLQFERKHKDPFQALPTARLVLATNNLPRFSDKSGGLWRRMILMPFTATISPEERIVGMDKPQWWIDSGELPGMLNWALEGLRRLLAQGRFTTSRVCEAALAEYRTESNPARMFLTEHYEEDPQGDVVGADIYAKYSQWCVSSGYRPLASCSFGREVKRAFPNSIKGKVRDFSGNRKEGYLGVREVLPV